MVAYTQNEMVGVTELSKSLSGFIDKVASNSIEKLAVIRHNKPEVVILSIAEYERMKELNDYIEASEIADIIKSRVTNRTTKANMITHDEMKQFLKSRGCNV